MTPTAARPHSRSQDQDGPRPRGGDGKGGKGGKGKGHGGKGRQDVLPAADRHLVNRFSYGLTRDLTAEVRRAGGAEKWFADQLRPDRVKDRKGDAVARWWPSLARGASDLWQRNITGVEYGWEVMGDYQRWLLVRRMTTRRQLLEVMTDFWENHLHVPVNADGGFVHRVSYGATIRQHALGRFDQMLQAAITHPAMLIYLDGAVSTASHPNENLGRELLELHTVGRGQYDENDVKDSARILTGWHVDMWKTWDPSYRGQDHWRGPVSVMGFSDANAGSDGRDLTMRYLSYLAHHPATAQRIAWKLCQKFVRDDPPQGLVDRLATVYRQNDTAIAPVLRELVDSKEFRGSRGDKVRDPAEDVVATYRALGVKVKAPKGTVPENHLAHVVLWQAYDLGAAPHNWPQPNGQPADNLSWASPSRVVASLDLHYALANGWWPKVGARYRDARKRLPGRKVRLAQLVDACAREVLGKKPGKALTLACCEALSLSPKAVITKDHPVVKYDMGRLLATLLDSPDHMTR